MDSYPVEFVTLLKKLAKTVGKWAALNASGDDAAEDEVSKADGLVNDVLDAGVLGEDVVNQVKDMAFAASRFAAARIILGDADDAEASANDLKAAYNPVPEDVDEMLWKRTKKLFVSAGNEQSARVTGSGAKKYHKQFERHAQFLAGLGRGRTRSIDDFAARAKEIMPGNVVMFSGCTDAQTSADVYNTATFGLPSDAGPGGAGGACTNSMIKALDDDNEYSWVGLLEKMRGILAGQYTQIPQLSSSQPMDLNAPFSVTNPAPSGRFRALLIGINYEGSNCALQGCHNDVETMRRYLTRHGYSDEDMRILMDDGEHETPDKATMVESLKWLVDGASAGDSLFLHYSGHGTSLPDDDGDEADGKDEALCPVDYNTGGFLRDDEAFQHLVAPLADGVLLTCVLDCCHSGSILDLPYAFKADDASLQQVNDGDVAEMQPNPEFDFGKCLEVIKEHPALCAAAVAVGGVAYCFMDNEQREQVGGLLQNLASNWFNS